MTFVGPSASSDGDARMGTGDRVLGFGGSVLNFAGNQFLWYKPCSAIYTSHHFPVRSLPGCSLT